MSRWTAWLAFIATAAALPAPQKPAEGTIGDFTPSSNGRTMTVNWASVTGAQGYFWEVKRCTKVLGTTDSDKCSTGYNYNQVTDTTNYITAAGADCGITCGSETCCSKTFFVDRGWFVRFHVWAATGSTDQPATSCSRSRDVTRSGSGRTTSA